MLYKEVKKKDEAVENLAIDSTALDGEWESYGILVEKLVLSNLGTISRYEKCHIILVFFLPTRLHLNRVVIIIFVIRELRTFSEIPHRISNISQTFSASWRSWGIRMTNNAVSKLHLHT